MVATISIVGLTSSGKTACALALAEYLLSSNRAKGVVLLSADSRQVYRGLEVLSGADIPSTFKESNSDLPYRWFKDSEKEIYLAGISIIEPTQDWSLALFIELADQVVDWCRNNKYQLIVVGGTGLYHKHLIERFELLTVPPNPELRLELEHLSLAKLQKQVKDTNPAAFKALNNSDVHNPRRLIRLIEKLQLSHSLKDLQQEKPSPFTNHTTVFIDKPFEEVTAAIAERIKNRLQQGVEAEVANLLKKNDVLPTTVTTTVGLKQVEILNKESDQKNRQSVLDQWLQQEISYAKRQLTWWKKHQPDITVVQPVRVADLALELGL